MRQAFLALAAALLLVLCWTPAQAADRSSDPQVSGVRVLEYGVFSSNVERRRRVASVADGIRDKARDFALVRRGAQVEARLGRGFGLRYQVTGAPRGATVLLDVVVRHPQMVNPDTQLPMTHSTAQYERTIGAVEHSLWNFDTSAGLIPGEYVIELSHRGQLLVRQAFTVTVKKER